MSAKPAIVGLTGGIATGKSTVARHMQRQGVAVFDADAAVHALYAPGAAAVAKICAAFGDVRDAEGGIDRQKLSAEIALREDGLRTVETIVHPMVREAEQAFVAAAAARGAGFVVLDIPLLFETGADRRCDFTVVVACGPDTQYARALQRPDMNVAKLELILSRQINIGMKAGLADAVINSEQPLEKMYQAVDDLTRELKARFPQAQENSG